MVPTQELSLILKKELSFQEKIERLKKPVVLEEKPSWFEELEKELSPLQLLALLSLFETRQAEKVLGPFPLTEKTKLLALLDALAEVEQFYAPLGGILGYQETILRLLEERKNSAPIKTEGLSFKAPPFIDLSHPEDPLYKRCAFFAIEHLGEMAEIYTAGGAADRLDLREEKSGEFLPAALLPFCGKTLLEHLLCDLEAKEYLHYKLFGRHIVTPVCIMTSPEKDNHARLLSFCEEKNWFGRGKDHFRLFVQPLVPTVDEEGQWGMQAPCQLLLRPGGHGVIWRLAAEEGIFDWLKSLGRQKALVRQISNIMPGVDGGLLAFTGIGCARDSSIGFASCSRFVRTSEGINVLLEKKSAGKSSYCLTSIEYCDLDLYGLEDEPMSLWNPYSKYPANTNILFVDLQDVESAAKALPFPGLLINAKKMKVLGKEGKLEEKEMVRLESTMQNIADAFTSEELPQKSYLTYNLRHKTISPIKRALLSEALFETAEGSLYDLLKNGRELLTKFCDFSLPELPLEEDFLKNRVPFLFLYHPALGPLYSIIAQKLQKGSLSLGSLLQLEIADLYVEGLHLEGALQIKTEGLAGNCFLKNVRIVNAGRVAVSGKEAWKMEPLLDTCEIFLEEGAEFFAENVTLKGAFRVVVPKHVKCSVLEEGGKLLWKNEPLSQSTWSYSYTQEGEKIRLKKKAS